MLRFVEATHQYFWDDVEVPGVSAILRETGQAKDWSQIPEFYRERGSAVHKAIQFFLKGTLNREDLDPIIRPYLDQFEAFLDTIQPVAGLVLSENPSYSKKLGFSGTIDLLMNGTIWDIKCSKKLDKSSTWQYRLQGAGYRTLIRENWGLDLPFKILLLPGEGSAQEIALDAPYEAWEHAMGLYRIKTKGE